LNKTGLERLFDSPVGHHYFAAMKKNLYLLAGVIALYLVSSVVLQGIYGPSYGFLSGEDCWVADNSGGWVKHGNPTDPMPTGPSVDVPLGMRYVPIFLPAALLILFYLTPLSRLIELPPYPQEEALSESHKSESGSHKRD
jgi:hypothetical protein